ncbi:MAG: hypothetical protein GY822_22865 [Deltaproteobacteria bacterium]|nr:hypothetical protein [Deltaproteobacteria bacterium]
MALPWVFSLLLIAMLAWHGGRSLLRPNRRVQMRHFIDAHPKTMGSLLLLPVLFLIVLGGLALLSILTHGA